VTERLSEITARIDGIGQLGAVVNAMRGIAAARVQEARGRLIAVDSYAATIARAIGEAVALLPPTSATGPRPPARLAIVLFCAEQGFAGAFSERVLDAVGHDLATAELFLIGTRGNTVAAERGTTAGWKCAFPAHSPGIPRLADRMAEALYPRIASGEIGRLDAAFAQRQPGHCTEVQRRRLFPLDMDKFPLPANAMPPLLNLAPAMLLRDLTTDYLFGQLCHAALHAFAAENEARMESMASARTQIERQLAILQASQCQVRQKEITAEIIELATGEIAIRSRRSDSHHATTSS
jgi:F-type H+-transporting ATPase subunit gamma